MSVGSLFPKVQKFVVKNAPTILAAMGAIGTVTAVVMSSEAALKAERVLENADFKKRNEDLCNKYLSDETKKNDICPSDDMLDEMFSNGMTSDELSQSIEKYQEKRVTLSTADKALIYAKCYAPTAIMTAASIFCIFGGNHISRQRIASLAGAYILKEAAFDEYKQKAEEIIGKKKANDISDEIIQQHINQNPPSDANTLQTNLANPVQLSLWYDETSNRYFYSNAEYIRRAELEGNRMLDKNGFVGINDIYSLLGIEEIPLGDDMGWQKDINGEVIIEIGSALLGPDVPCGTIKMEVRPTSAWLSEV